MIQTVVTLSGIAAVVAIVTFYVLRKRKRQSVKFVRVYDFATRTTSTIPAPELAPGMIQANVGSIGLVWVDATQLKKGEYCHPPFPDAIRQMLLDIKTALDEVYPLTFEEWEDGFRRDQHPEREIAIWLHIASTYRRCTSGQSLSIDQCADYFRIITQCSNSPRENVLHTTKITTITREQALKAIEMFYIQAHDINFLPLSVRIQK